MEEVIRQLGLNKFSISLNQDITASFDLKVIKNKEDVHIIYRLKNHLYKALAVLKTFEDEENFIKEEKSIFPHLAYLIDVARDAVPKIETLKKEALNLAFSGFNQIYLYLEDVLEIKDEPFFGHLRGRYTKEEIQEFDKYCQSLGIELIPAIQTLAHLNAIFLWPEYNQINDIDDILLVNNERTYLLIDRMFKTINEYFTSKTVHIGMDEAHKLGRGKYLDTYGHQKTSDIMLNHLNKVNEIANKYKFKLEMWSDMFFRMSFGDYYDKTKTLPIDVINKVPSNINQVYWDYVTDDKRMLNNMFRNHSLFKGETIFASGGWKWNGWNPQNNFSIYLANIQLKECEKHHVQKVILTAWSDDGAEASLFSNLPTIIYYGAYSYAHKTNITYLNQISSKVYDFRFKDFLSSDLLMVKKEEEIDHYNHLNYGNMAKIIMYSDPFSSLYNVILKRFSLDNISSLKKEMKICKKRNPSYYLYFNNLEKLCDCLLIKAHLAKNIKESYLNKNIKELDNIANIKIPKLIKNIDAFINTFKEQWLKENKTNSFEVHAVRLGGLKERLKFIKDIIKLYLKGDINQITELEQPDSEIDDISSLVMVLYTTYKRIWTVNVA